MEINKIKSAISVDEMQKSKSFEWSDFKMKTVQKAMIIGFVLVVLNQFSGVVAMLTYTANIFVEAGSNLSPNMSAIVVGAIQLFSTIITTNLVDRAGRKVSLFFLLIFPLFYILIKNMLFLHSFYLQCLILGQL